MAQCSTGHTAEWVSWNNFRCWSSHTPATWMCRSSTAAWCPSGLKGEYGGRRFFVTRNEWSEKIGLLEFLVSSNAPSILPAWPFCWFPHLFDFLHLLLFSFLTSPLVSVEGPTPFTILQDLDTDIGFSVFSSVCFPTSVMHSGSYFANLVPGHLVGWLEGIVLLAQFCWLPFGASQFDHVHEMTYDDIQKHKAVFFSSPSLLPKESCERRAMKTLTASSVRNGKRWCLQCISAQPFVVLNTCWLVFSDTWPSGPELRPISSPIYTWQSFGLLHTLKLDIPWWCLLRIQKPGCRVLSLSFQPQWTKRPKTLKWGDRW